MHGGAGPVIAALHRRSGEAQSATDYHTSP